MNPIKDPTKKKVRKNLPSPEACAAIELYWIPQVPLPKKQEPKLILKAKGGEADPTANTIRIGLLPKESEREHRQLALHQNKLCNKFLAELEALQMPDMVVRVGDTDFKVYSALMMVYSDLFVERHAKTKMVYLPSNSMTPRIFRFIYQWMRTKEVFIDKADVSKMNEAADYLQIGLLVVNLRPYLDFMNSFSPE